MVIDEVNARTGQANSSRYTIHHPKYTFEVGGKSKGKRQIENVPDSYVVKDDIEFAHGNVIPLWAFGLNY